MTDKEQFLVCLEDIIRHYHEVIRKLQRGEPFEGIKFRKVQRPILPLEDEKKIHIEIEQEPLLGPDVSELIFKFPSGKRITRYFLCVKY